MKKSKLMKILLGFISFSIFFSCFLPIAYSDDVGIFDGMIVEHQFRRSIQTGVSSMELTFTEISEEMFHIYIVLGWPANMVGSWDVNTTTRIASNVVPPGTVFGPFESNHSVFWIYTDISLNDQIRMCNIWRCVHGYNGDVLFNVTGEATHGSMNVWILEDAYGSELWYEKTKGFLVNGTINHLTDWYNYTFVDTNALDVPAGPAIPGYGYFLLIGAISVIGIIIIRSKSKKE
jgi:hypothetical protein